MAHRVLRHDMQRYQVTPWVHYERSLVVFSRSFRL